MNIEQTHPHAIRIPGTFARDRIERCDDGIVVLSRGPSWTMRLTDDALVDLAADARYYASDVDDAPRNIIASARRTVEALKRAGFEG